MKLIALGYSISDVSNIRGTSQENVYQIIERLMSKNLVEKKTKRESSFILSKQGAELVGLPST
jgi:predicted transcriptional regulator